MGKVWFIRIEQAETFFFFMLESKKTQVEIRIIIAVLEHNLCYLLQKSQALDPGLRARKGVTDARFAPCKAIQDSLEFRIPRRGFRVPGTEFWIAYQWQTMAKGIPNSLSWITDTKPRIPDSASKNF